MKITLKDGSVKEYAESKSVLDIAFDISEGLARAACAGEVNGEVVDLRTVIEEDAELNILTANDAEGLAALRHTASHVLAEAVKRLYPEAKLAIGPSIDTGFYYDFEHEPFSSEDLESIEKEMKKIIKENAKIERFELPREEAIAFMEEKGYTYPVLMDTEGELFASYGIMSFPTTFMIDRDGNVFGYVSGMLSADMMDSIVRQTLDGKMEGR